MFATQLPTVRGDLDSIPDVLDGIEVGDLGCHASNTKFVECSSSHSVTILEWWADALSCFKSLYRSTVRDDTTCTKLTDPRLHHRGSKLDPRSDLRSTQKTFCTILVQSWTGDQDDDVHFEPPKLAVPNLDPRSAATIDESDIQNHEITLVQHFYTGAKIKLDPVSELGSFNLGSGKMLVQPGIRDGNLSEFQEPFPNVPVHQNEPKVTEKHHGMCPAEVRCVPTKYNSGHEAPVNNSLTYFPHRPPFSSSVGAPWNSALQHSSPDWWPANKIQFNLIMYLNQGLNVNNKFVICSCHFASSATAEAACPATQLLQNYSSFAYLPHQRVAKECLPLTSAADGRKMNTGNLARPKTYSRLAAMQVGGSETIQRQCCQHYTHEIFRPINYRLARAGDRTEATYSMPLHVIGSPRPCTCAFKVSISQFGRTRMVTLPRGGHTARAEIARLVGVTQKPVSEMCKRFRETNSVHERRGRGQSWSDSSTTRAVQYIDVMARRRPAATARELRNDLLLQESQTDGMAMGSSFPPSWPTYSWRVSNKRHWTKPTLRIKSLHYADDTFLSRQHGTDKLDEFANFLNSLRPSLQFPYETETNESLPFLNILVSKKDQIITTNTYRNPIHAGRCPQRPETLQGLSTAQTEWELLPINAITALMSGMSQGVRELHTERRGHTKALPTFVARYFPQMKQGSNPDKGHGKPAMPRRITGWVPNDRNERKEHFPDLPRGRACEPAATCSSVVATVLKPRSILESSVREKARRGSLRVASRMWLRPHSQPVRATRTYTHCSTTTALKTTCCGHKCLMVYQRPHYQSPWMGCWWLGIHSAPHCCPTTCNVPPARGHFISTARAPPPPPLFKLAVVRQLASLVTSGVLRPGVPHRQALRNKFGVTLPVFRTTENLGPRARAEVAERLARSPPTKVGLNSRPGNWILASEIRAGRCRWSAGFLGDLPRFPHPFIPAPLRIHSNHPHRL
ncbi:hypothetical protein PR048_021429 [Dryococelus australis]|uniref:Uncharacterized protein n=1 Tax=Dryococelus australis TaxID=614101 RepID=A0ABQ9GY58_9NEOP|nr:hypothetical protein PR048_021429 [Dryococelus australis]